MEVTNNVDIKPNELLSLLAKNMGVMVEYSKRPEAFYTPDRDTITLPLPRYFLSQGEFASVMTHELSHSTGHKSRLDRDIKNIFGSEKYAFEELVAEVSTTFFSVNLKDIDVGAFNNFENNVAYVQSWIEAIRDKPEALIRAVKEATKVTDYMEMKAGITPENEYNRKQHFEKITATTTGKNEEQDKMTNEKTQEYARSTVTHQGEVPQTQRHSQMRMKF